MKPLVRREQADADVLAALNYYIVNAAEYALSFIDDLEQAYSHIKQYPASGSTRYAHELNIPELRVWACNKFPYLVFYVEYTNQIEVWRVLHGSRDIPASLHLET
jgi:toxin ParE1/3/4